MFRTKIAASYLLAGSLLLAACGGSGSSSSASSNPPPVTANKVTRGTITAVGASTITVNSVQLDLSAAKVKVEGVEKSRTELKKGMVVVAKGSFDDKSGEAVEVQFEDAVKGRVEGKGADDLVVAGTHVSVDDSTEFEHAGRMADVSAGQRLRISGVPDDKGGVRATRVEDDHSAVDDSFEVKGYVSSLGAGSFSLSLTAGGDPAYQVTFAGAAPAGLVNGAFVEVHAAAPPAQGSIAVTATLITVEDRSLEQEAAEVEVEGIVSSGTSAAFVVDGESVVTNASTRWEFGLEADFAVGLKVEAEGHSRDSSGALVADKVSFRAVNRLQGAASNVSFSNGVGTLTVLGFTVTVNTLTDNRFPAVANGDVVEVRGMPARDGSGLVATRIDQGSGGNASRIFLTGPVQAVDATAGTLTIMGVTVQTGSASFLDHAEVAMTRAAFFAGIEANRTVVKARGRDASALSGGVLQAEEVEIENEPSK